MNTLYRKTDSGWKADTEVELDFSIEGKPAVLQLQTYKYSGVLVSRAGVCTKDNGFTTTRLFRDFSGRYIQDTARCTEKNLKAQHERLLTFMATIMEEVRDHHIKLGDIVVPEAA